MAETFIAIGAAVSGAASSAATAVSGLFGGGAAAAGTASGLSSVLSIGSALSSVAMGFSSAAAAKDQAAQVGIQDAQSKAQDAQQRASLAEEYADIVADQTAVQIANGLNPGVGTPATIRRATTEVAERNLSVSRENTLNRSRTARARQRSLYKSANTAILGGFVGGGNAMLANMEATG